MTPVALLIESPAGKPVALNVNASPSASLAAMARLTATPVYPLRFPGLVTTGGLLGSGAEDSWPPICSTYATRLERSVALRLTPACAVTAAAIVGAEPSCRYGAVAHTSRNVGTSRPFSGPPRRLPLAGLIVPTFVRFAAALRVKDPPP